MAEALISSISFTNLQATGVDFGQRGTYSISGTKWEDVDANGTRDAGEPGLAGWTIYIDDNDNSQVDLGEFSTVTRGDDPATAGVDETGFYRIEHLPPGSHVVREVRQPGWQQRFPEDAHRHLQRRSQRPFRPPDGKSFLAHLQSIGLQQLETTLGKRRPHPSAR